MKANNDKSLILLGCRESSTAVIDGSSIESNRKEALLGITVAGELKFDDHVKSLCKKSCQNLMLLLYFQLS